jgi:hypothetical protein
MTVIILCVVPKLCGAKSYQLFAPKPQAENLCPSALVPPMTLPGVLVSHPPQGDTGSEAVSGRRTTRVSPVTEPHCCHCLCTWPECPNLSPCENYVIMKNFVVLMPARLPLLSRNPCHVLVMHPFSQARLTKLLAVIPWCLLVLFNPGSIFLSYHCSAVTLPLTAPVPPYSETLALYAIPTTVSVTS